MISKNITDNFRIIMQSLSSTKILAVANFSTSGVSFLKTSRERSVITFLLLLLLLSILMFQKKEKYLYQYLAIIRSYVNYPKLVSDLIN